MKSEETNFSVSEYKFTFSPHGTAIPSERHFSATNPTIAREMFDFACRKDEIQVDQFDLSVWNRWANRWDDISPEDSEES